MAFLNFNWDFKGVKGMVRTSNGKSMVNILISMYFISPSLSWSLIN